MQCIRFKAFMATEFSSVFSGNQLCKCGVTVQHFGAYWSPSSGWMWCICSRISPGTQPPMYVDKVGPANNNERKDHLQPVACYVQVKQHRLGYSDDWPPELCLLFLLADLWTKTQGSKSQSWVQVQWAFVPLITLDVLIDTGGVCEALDCNSVHSLLRKGFHHTFQAGRGMGEWQKNSQASWHRYQPTILYDWRSRRLKWNVCSS